MHGRVPEGRVMVLLDTQTQIDPRVAFWSDPTFWPRDASGVVFLGRIVLHLGYRERADAQTELGLPRPRPNSEEWALARAWSEEIESATSACLERFLAVIGVLRPSAI